MNTFFTGSKHHYVILTCTLQRKCISAAAPRVPLHATYGTACTSVLIDNVS